MQCRVNLDSVWHDTKHNPKKIQIIKYTPWKFKLIIKQKQLIYLVLAIYSEQILYLN